MAFLPGTLLAATGLLVPLIAAAPPGSVSSQAWFGPLPVDAGCPVVGKVLGGYGPVALFVRPSAGVTGSIGSSAKVQLRALLPPWSVCTNQSRLKVRTDLSISFLSEIDPSEQVVWLWKSPVT